MTIEEQTTMKAIQKLSTKIPEVTLRDLFAMASLAGLSANVEFNYKTIQEIVETAYEQADYMMKERNK